MRNCKLSAITLALCLSYGLATPTSLANETASNMRGHITDTAGKAVTDVTVSIMHVPTGAMTTVKVDGKGNFSARGLRVGGPYRIVIDSQTLADDTIENVYLNVGETFRLNRKLATQSSIETIRVVGSASSISNIADTNYFGEDAIDRAPSLNRDLKDVLRQNPFAAVDPNGVTLSVAGLNPRYNSFVVDGISQNDDFGLNANGYPSQRSPISIDAVESVALDVAPFSVRNGGFSGAQVNVVTKSGTNDVSGTVFWQITNDSLAGDGKNEFGEKVTQNFEEETYGATLGLPFIQDTLFFFGSYEKFDSPQQQEYGPAGTGFANDGKVTTDEFDSVKSIAANKYSLSDIGAYDSTPIEQDEKLLLKLDWEITDDHRASLTYQNTDGNQTNATNSERNLNLSSYSYNRNEELTTFAVNVYSDWSDEFSTEFKIAHKDTNTLVNPVTPLAIGSVSIKTESGGTINFGTERFRQANQLNNQNLEVYFAGDYTLGDHNIGFGAEYNHLEVYNLFASDALGTWNFNSIADFQAGDVDRFRYNNAASKNISDVAADLDMDTLALFVEDTWIVNEDLELTYGIRYETTSMSNKPILNDNFADRYGFANNETLDGKDIWLPRVGFNYILSDNMTLKGGVGRFSGGKPNVWVANSFSNDGRSLLSYRGGWQDSFGTPIFGEIPEAAHLGLAGGDGDVNAIDPNFKLPSDWRFNLGLNTTWDFDSLGDDWFIGTEFLYIKQENDLAWKDLGRRAVKTDASGRVVYETWDPLANDGAGGDTRRRDILLTNADKEGSSINWSLTVAKEWANGVDFRASYAFNRVKEGNPGGSSRASSNYQYNYTQFDRNSTTLGTGNFETPHSFIFSAGYETEFVAGYASRFDVFYDIKQGRPLTWLLGSEGDKGFGDQSGFSYSEAYLPYIPNGENDPNVAYSGGLDYQTFINAVKEVGLEKYAGTIAPKGADNQPWTHQLDFSFSQEIPGFSEEHRGVIYFDVRNVLNLLNDDWGRVEYQNRGNKILVDYDYAPDSGIYTYSVPEGQDNIEIDNYNMYNINKSVWQMQIGVKYKF